jgi:glycerate kinase
MKTPAQSAIAKKRTVIGRTHPSPVVAVATEHRAVGTNIVTWSQRRPIATTAAGTGRMVPIEAPT